MSANPRIREVCEGIAVGLCTPLQGSLADFYEEQAGLTETSPFLGTNFVLVYPRIVSLHRVLTNPDLLVAIALFLCFAVITCRRTHPILV